jgi:hypothetical protein
VPPLDRSARRLPLRRALRHAWERCRQEARLAEVRRRHRVRCHLDGPAPARCRSVGAGAIGGPVAARRTRCSRQTCACISRSGAASCSARSVTVRAVDGVSLNCARAHAGAGRRIGLRQDDGRQGDPATDPATGGSVQPARAGTRRSRRAQPCAPLRAHADGFPGSLRLAQSAHAHRRDHRRGHAALGRRVAGQRPGRGDRRLLEQVGLRAEAPPALSARVLRRAAPAHRHRPCAGGAAGSGDLRRADLGARRLGAGADPQSAGRRCRPISGWPTCSSPTTSPWSIIWRTRWR